MFDIEHWTPLIYDLNEKWWTDLDTGKPIERDEGELFCLMSSELSEAMEGERKNLDDDKLPQFKMAGVEMVDFSIRLIDYASRRDLKLVNYFDEAATRFPWVAASPQSNRAGLIWKMEKRLARCDDMVPYAKAEQFSWLIADARRYCALFGYPFEDMFSAKYQFNVDRADHKHESRRLANGKKF